MINEITVRPKPQNNKAKTVFFVALLVSVAVFAVSMFIPHYKGVVALVGMLGIVTAILIYTKYVSVEFRYDVTFDRDETPIFVVRQLIGRRETTLCRIALKDVIKIEKEDKETRKKHITEKETSVYSYNPTLMPDIVYRITSRSEQERAEIIIECSDEFAALLEDYVREAREPAPSEE